MTATAGEIIRVSPQDESEDDSSDAETKIKTAVYWLEEADLLVRDENRISVYPSSLMVSSSEEAYQRLVTQGKTLTEARRKVLLKIVTHLLEVPEDKGASTDDLLRVSHLSNSRLVKALHDLERFGIMKNDLAVTVYVHVGVVGSSRKKIEELRKIERELISLMREREPDGDQGDRFILQLNRTVQELKDKGYKNARPDIIKNIVQGIAADGRDRDGGEGSFRIKVQNRDTLILRLGRSWHAIDETSKLRLEGANTLLNYVLGQVAIKERRKNIAVDTTVGDLLAALKGNILFNEGQRKMDKLMERSLLWMHEQGIATLGKGLSIFRSALTLTLRPGNKRFTKENYRPLEDYYREKTVQIHIMAEYAKTGLLDIEKALLLAKDYFDLTQVKFMKAWFPGRDREVTLQTTVEKRHQIVAELGNKNQEEIVEFDQEETNLLVLAGPGSGKTRVLVHRIAYLIQVKRELPESILVLVYNRHAALEIKNRLRNLAGDDAIGVTVKTCHSFAMQVIGLSFANKSSEERNFESILKDAVKLISGDGLETDEAEEQRKSLIYGYKWIFVDEYQDVGQNEYALIAAIAGRSLEDDDLKLSMFAVGDDDQNIYSFKGASVEFIRRFKEDYKAKISYLVDNYRSTAHIIKAANSVISHSQERMKTGHDIVIDQHRSSYPAGGILFHNDNVAEGRVQVLQCPRNPRVQSVIAVEELRRLSKLDSEWDWNRVAIIAREWKDLEFAMAYAKSLKIPVSLANKNKLNIWRFRETTELVNRINLSNSDTLTADYMHKLLSLQQTNRWTTLLGQGIEALREEIGHKAITKDGAKEWLAEWTHDAKTSQRGLLLLVAHRAKGLEFDHVVILDGNWRGGVGKGGDRDAPCRLYYVAMTRARKSLARITSYRGLSSLKKHKSFLVRSVLSPSIDVQSLNKKYIIPEMTLVDLGYAGRLGSEKSSSKAILQAISEATADEKICLYENEKRLWEIRNEQGVVLGRMQRNFKPPAGYKLVKAKIGAITTRYKSDTKADEKNEYQSRIRRDRWEVILPDLIFGRHGQDR